MTPEELSFCKELGQSLYIIIGLLSFIAVYIVLRDVIKYISSWFKMW